MSLVGILRQRLAGPHAAQVVELAELAVAEAERSLEQIDDSGGSVMPAIQELVSVHHEACLQTHPDPVWLAERLFRLQTERGMGHVLRRVAGLSGAAWREGVATVSSVGPGCVGSIACARIQPESGLQIMGWRPTPIGTCDVRVGGTGR